MKRLMETGWINILFVKRGINSCFSEKTLSGYSTYLMNARYTTLPRQRQSESIVAYDEFMVMSCFIDTHGVGMENLE